MTTSNSQPDQGPDIQPMTLEQKQADRNERGYIKGDRVRFGWLVGTVESTTDLGWRSYSEIRWDGSIITETYRDEELTLIEEE